MAETKIKKEDIELLIPASSPEVLRIISAEKHLV